MLVKALCSTIWIRSATFFGHENGADSVIECSGAQASLDLGLEAATPRAAIAMVSRGNYNIDVKYSFLMAKELEISLCKLVRAECNFQPLCNFTGKMRWFAVTKTTAMIPFLNVQRLVTKTYAL